MNAYDKAKDKDKQIIKAKRDVASFFKSKRDGVENRLIARIDRATKNDEPRQIRAWRRAD